MQQFRQGNMQENGALVLLRVSVGIPDKEVSTTIIYIGVARDSDCNATRGFSVLPLPWHSKTGLANGDAKMNYQDYLDYRHLIAAHETIQGAVERRNRDMFAALAVTVDGAIAFYLALGRQGKAPEREIC